MPKTTDRAVVARRLREARRVLVVMHEAPDGDTTGSALGLAMALSKLGIAAQVLGPDPIIPPFHFLPGAARASTWRDLRPETRYDVVVTVDCGEASRAGGMERLRAAAPVLINLDHHISNSRFGDINWVDPAAVAVAELVMQLIDDFGLPLDEDLALPLYVSLATDTEGFRVGIEDGRVFRLAARLAEAGLDVRAIHRRLFEEEPLSSVRLKGWALQHIRRSPSGRLAWVALTRQVAHRFQVEPYESDGLITLVRTIADVRLAIFFREEERGWVKVSLRSRPPLEARVLAEHLGGGGHTHAAAAKVRGRLQAVGARTLELAAELYGEDARWTDSSIS
ncbi:MAG: DHH family phosphoesterase [Clostridia bacterium]